MAVEIRDVAAGLWIWRQEHPDWRPGLGWSGPVTSTYVESRGEVAVLDALAPSDDATEFWERLNAKPPTVAVVLKPDHVRSVDLFVQRYSVRAYGPDVFFAGDAPETELDWFGEGMELPGGLMPLYDGRGRNETPLYLPEQRTIVFADAMTAPEGELRIWWTPWHERRVLPAFRELLEFPFEHVIVAHGEPVHDRDEFERALERAPHKGE